MYGRIKKIGTDAQSQRTAQIIHWNRMEVNFSHTSTFGDQLCTIA
jgi:hypothetical protein